MSLLTSSVLQPKIDTHSQSHISTPTLYCNLLTTTIQAVIGYLFVDIVIAISLHYIAQDLGIISNAAFAFCMNISNAIILPIGAGLN